MGVHTENLDFESFNRVVYKGGDPRGEAIDLYAELDLKRSATLEEVRAALAKYAKPEKPKNGDLSNEVKRALKIYDLMSRFKAEYDSLLGQEGIQTPKQHTWVLQSPTAPFSSKRLRA